MDKLEARLANTEKALHAVVTTLYELQPPSTQRNLDRIMLDYFDANTSLGFEPRPDFISDTDLPALLQEQAE